MINDMWEKVCLSVCLYVCICLNIIYDGLRAQCVFQNGIAWNHSKWTCNVDEHGLKWGNGGC